MRSKWLLALLLLTLFGACVQESEPWAETELSRAIASKDDLGALDKHLGLFSPKPNLYDLHHRQGALATLSDWYPEALFRFLRVAKLPVEFDPASETFSYDGELRRLQIGFDKTRVELPQTRTRQSLPNEIGLISVTENSMVRVSSGEEFSSPLPVEDVPAFAAYWVSKRTVEKPAPPATGPAVEALVIELSPRDKLTLDGRSVPVETLAEELATILGQDEKPLLLLPQRGTTYGDFVAILDQIHQAVAAGVGIRLALPRQTHRERYGDGGTAIPTEPRHLTQPVLVLKVDARAPYSKIDEVLTGLEEHFSHIVLLTHLDISDRATITTETWPGGLPGGIVLPLASADGTVAAADPQSYGASVQGY